MSAREYKKYFSLDLKRGIVPEDYKEVMRRHVYTNGTIDNLKNGAKYRFKKGHSMTYQRSNETMERLKAHFERIANRKGRPKKQYYENNNK